VIFQNNSEEDTGNVEQVEIEGEQIKTVPNFIYLGGTLTQEASSSATMKRRLQLAKGKFWGTYRNFFFSRCGVKLKMRIYKTCILPVMLYGCGTWTTTVKDINMMETAQMDMLRRILGKTRRDRWRNARVLKITGTCSIEEIIRYERLKVAGRVLAMKEHRLPRKILLGEPLRDRDPNTGKLVKMRTTGTWRKCLIEDLQKFWIRNYFFTALRPPPEPRGTKAKKKWNRLIKHGFWRNDWKTEVEIGRKQFRDAWNEENKYKYRKAHPEATPEQAEKMVVIPLPEDRPKLKFSSNAQRRAEKRRREYNS
jgi:hypothetical protein